MITLTYNEAMTIQNSQLKFYRQFIGRSGVKAIRAQTKPCPGNPDKPMSIFVINELVPRGGDFERYIKGFPETYDKTRLAWANAVRRGLPY